MEQNLDQTIALLSHTPSALNALLRDLGPEWTTHNEGENTWTALDVVRHLALAERTNWMVRLNWLLQYGESRAFEPFQRTGEVEAASMAEALDQFAQARAQNLDKLRALELEPDQLERAGMHPTFGRVTLSQMLATWAVHDMTHLHQVSRILAHQYREAVGPWIRFLGVLKCTGHSE